MIFIGTLRFMFHYFCIPFLSILFFLAPVFSETKPVGFAILFPELTFQQILSKEEQAYLGIPRKTNFSFKEIRGSLIFVEFMSTYCVSCQRQAPIFNEVYASIEKDPRLKGKVKMIGIAAGNTLKEVESFKREYKVPYPIFTDNKFDAHAAVGSPRTPFTIWVRRDAQGKSSVVSTHLGLIDSEKNALEETKAILQYDLALLKPKKGTIYEGDALMPPLMDRGGYKEIEKPHRWKIHPQPFYIRPRCGLCLRSNHHRCSNLRQPG